MAKVRLSAEEKTSVENALKGKRNQINALTKVNGHFQRLPQQQLIQGFTLETYEYGEGTSAGVLTVLKGKNQTKVVDETGNAPWLVRDWSDDD